MNSKKNYIRNIQNSPVDGFSQSQLLVSSLNTFNRNQFKTSLSIKIVETGTEQYTISGKKYCVKSNEFIVVNQNEDLTTTVDTVEDTKGVCIYPPIELIYGAFERLTLTNNEILDGQHYVLEPKFTHKISRLKHHSTGKFLASFLRTLNFKTSFTGNELLGFYMALAETLVADQIVVNNDLRKLKPSRKSTSEELYRRLLLSKDYIHDHQTEKFNLDELARISCLSKYHFLRNFKDVFGQSPYQYILHLKLQKALHLIHRGYSYIETSDLIGFSDPKNLKRAIAKYKSTCN